eukprot:gene5933-15947_t
MENDDVRCMMERSSPPLSSAAPFVKNVHGLLFTK